MFRQKISNWLEFLLSLTGKEHNMFVHFLFVIAVNKIAVLSINFELNEAF